MERLTDIIPDPGTRRFLCLVYAHNRDLAAELALAIVDGTLTDEGWVDEAVSGPTGDSPAATLSTARNAPISGRQMRLI